MQQEWVRQLLAWYKENARPLPWRDTPDPYRVWVSEVMLQQTRIEAVRPYFDRFMQELPTIRALAQVPTERLMKLWEGLGYYSRARNLQAAARQLMDRYDGEMPASYEELLALPGIGEYTAGAVASIAFGIPVPAVDGNVLRVMARLLCCDRDVMQPVVRKELTGILRTMVPADAPGQFNQALMELGETICLPRTEPHCDACPIQSYCEASARHCARELPVRAKPKERRIEKRTVLLLIRAAAEGRQVLVRKRPPKGLLAGLWELPNAEGWYTQQNMEERIRQYGLSLKSLFALQEAKHVFSHIEWHMQGWCVQVSGDTPETAGKWVDSRELAEEIALPSAFRAYSALLPVLLQE